MEYVKPVLCTDTSHGATHSALLLSCYLFLLKVQPMMVMGDAFLTFEFESELNSNR